MPTHRRRAKDLRRSQTEAEAFVWGELRSRRFAGFKFRRQVQLGNYIVDFVCLEHGRVSGVGRDGRCHLARVARASVAAPPKRPPTPHPSPPVRTGVKGYRVSETWVTHLLYLVGAERTQLAERTRTLPPP